jgi:uncharacterized BrkB/YihY/UPF0761 family membrane protein
MVAVDGWQRRHPWAGVPYAVLKKFGDDNANLLVVALAWYGFTAIFPLLLVVVTLFGFIGQQSIGTGIVRTLHEFPVVGSSFNPESSHALHGSTIGLVIGLIGLLYGAQGVTQTAQQAMATVWNIPQYERTGFLPRLGRSLGSLLTIGAAFVINAFVTGYATGGTTSYAIRIPVLAGLLVLNVGLYFATFTLLTAKVIGPRGLLPGAIVGAVAFTALITLGTGLITHQLKNASATYGAFGSVIGIVAFLLLLAKLSMYATELNPVLARRLYPRALPMVSEPTDADRQALTALVRTQQRLKDEAISVGFGDQAADGDQQRLADRLRVGGEAGMQFHVVAHPVIEQLLPLEPFHHKAGPAGHPAGGRIVHPVPELEPEQAEVGERPAGQRAAGSGRHSPALRGGRRPVGHPAGQVPALDAAHRHAAENIPVIGQRSERVRRAG